MFKMHDITDLAMRLEMRVGEALHTSKHIL